MDDFKKGDLVRLTRPVDEDGDPMWEWVGFVGRVLSIDADFYIGNGLLLQPVTKRPDGIKTDCIWPSNQCDAYEPDPIAVVRGMIQDLIDNMSFANYGDPDFTEINLEEIIKYIDGSI